MRLHITGVVQGVGFRPFVYRLARRIGLEGAVWNDGAGVVIEAVGSVAALERFLRNLRAEAPPAAVIERIASARADELTTRSGGTFGILPSRNDRDITLGVSPDLATCALCLTEVHDPTDRRFAYPFTNCGPRLSILEGAPYDHPETTMATFAMCDICRREYDDPKDRRFHAQPNACPACGPALRFERCADHAVVTRLARDLERVLGADRPWRIDRHQGHRRLSPRLSRDRRERCGAAARAQAPAGQAACRDGTLPRRAAPSLRRLASGSGAAEGAEGPHCSAAASTELWHRAFGRCRSAPDRHDAAVLAAASSAARGARRALGHDQRQPFGPAPDHRR